MPSLRSPLLYIAGLLLASQTLGACASDADDAEADYFANPDDPSGKGDSADSLQLSHVGHAVVSALNATAAKDYKKTWTVSLNNRLDAGWLNQTPPQNTWGMAAAAVSMPALCTSGATCDTDFGLLQCSKDSDCGASGHCAALGATRHALGDAPKKLCVGHSDEQLDRIYNMITSAKASVDITSLTPADGRFEATIRNAITALGKANRAVTVRMLYGNFPVYGTVDAQVRITTLTRDLPASAPVTVYFGNYRSSNAPPSWNHSKIIAIDGQVALVGGHNMWTKHYLDTQPVHDMSMTVSGPAAVHAHRWADIGWQWTCSNQTWITSITKSVASRRWRKGSIDQTCPGDISLPTPPPMDGNIAVIGAGRMAWLDKTNSKNADDTAIVAMLEDAHESIRISQQDIGPVKIPYLGIPIGAWPEDVLNAVGAALVRGVDVKLVVSSPDSQVGGLAPTDGGGYSNGWSLQDIADQIRMRIEKMSGTPRGAALDKILCQKLHVAPLRFGPDDAWVNGKPPGNHVKLVVIDGIAFQIGSQNIYTAGLTEFSYIVDNVAAAKQVIANYWDPMWTWSSRRAIPGATCPAGVH